MLYMRVWADKSNIDCCCSEACQPTHVASTACNKLHINLTYKILIYKISKNGKKKKKIVDIIVGK